MTCPKSLIKVHVKQMGAGGKLQNRGKPYEKLRKSSSHFRAQWHFAPFLRPSPARQPAIEPLPNWTSGLRAETPGAVWGFSFFLMTMWFSGTKQALPLGRWLHSLPSVSSPPATRIHKTQWGEGLVFLAVARAFDVSFLKNILCHFKESSATCKVKSFTSTRQP